MEINKLLFKPIKVPVEFYYMLLRHLQYSIKDIESYDELTKEEKEIFPKDIFENLIMDNLLLLKNLLIILITNR